METQIGHTDGWLDKKTIRGHTGKQTDRLGTQTHIQTEQTEQQKTKCTHRPQ